MSTRQHFKFQQALSELQCVLLAHRAAADDGSMKLAWIDFDILDYLQRRGSFTSSQLCSIFNLSRSNMSKHLKRLKEYDLVEYVQNEDDGRSFYISISKNGIGLMNAVHNGHQKLAAQAERALTEEEQRQFSILAKKITDELDDPALHMI